MKICVNRMLFFMREYKAVVAGPKDLITYMRINFSIGGIPSINFNYFGLMPLLSFSITLSIFCLVCSIGSCKRGTDASNYVVVVVQSLRHV